MVFRKAPFKFGRHSVRRKTSRWIIDDKTTVYNDQVHPQIPFMIREKRYNMKYKPDNTPGGQLYGLSFSVTDLLRDERIVLGYNRATEIRGYVERLIVEAMRNGDRHRATMDLANFWIREKSLIHKLFKVFVPRYQDYTSAFTAIHVLGNDYSQAGLPFSEVTTYQNTWYKKGGETVLEMRGNCLPPIIRPKLNRSGLLTNILIDEARKNYQSERDTKEVD